MAHKKSWNQRIDAKIAELNLHRWDVRTIAAALLNSADKISELESKLGPGVKIDAGTGDALIQIAYRGHRQDENCEHHNCGRCAFMGNSALLPPCAQCKTSDKFCWWTPREQITAIKNAADKALEVEKVDA
jgi:hypothetical protein